MKEVMTIPKIKQVCKLDAQARVFTNLRKLLFFVAKHVEPPKNWDIAQYVEILQKIQPQKHYQLVALSAEQQELQTEIIARLPHWFQDLVQPQVAGLHRQGGFQWLIINHTAVSAKSDATKYLAIDLQVRYRSLIGDERQIEILHCNANLLYSFAILLSYATTESQRELLCSLFPLLNCNQPLYKVALFVEDNLTTTNQVAWQQWLQQVKAQQEIKIDWQKHPSRVVTVPQLEPTFQQAYLETEVSSNQWEKVQTTLAQVIPDLPTLKHKLNLVLRKLNRQHALGMFEQDKWNIVINAQRLEQDDSQFMNTFIHEYGHALDYDHDEHLSSQPAFQTICQYAKTEIDQLAKVNAQRKAYYKRPAEVFARSFEIYWYFGRSVNVANQREYQNIIGYRGLLDHLPAIQQYFASLGQDSCASASLTTGKQLVATMSHPKPAKSATASTTTPTQWQQLSLF